MKKHPAGTIFAFTISLVLVAFVLFSWPAFSYLPALEGPNTMVHWSLSSFPIQWDLNPDITGAKISGSRAVADAIQAAFNTWQSAPNVVLPVSRGPDSSVTSESSSPANINLICFICTGANFSDAGTLAITLFTFSTAAGQNDGHGGLTQFAGQMIKADILFNPNPSNVSFTTDPGAVTPDGSVVDLQTIATHEIGHFFGLDHSAVVNAVMFPFSAPIRESLAYDDVAGMSLLYPKGTPNVVTSAISGTIRFTAGGGVFGAHVFADSTTAVMGYPATIRKSPIGALTDPSGNYLITGLPVDSYNVSVEPLDGPITNSDVADYPKVFGMGSVQTNFTTRQH